jgi:hypothetical protein
MYIVYACAYYPIWVFVMATLVILLSALVLSIRKKDVWIFLLAIAGYAAAFSLVIIEGKETYYRSAQFLPVICGFGAMIFVWAMNSVKGKMAGFLRILACLILSVILWNQCADMNKWFYVDWQKYEAAKETVHNVAYELEKNFDTSKPIVFTGTYEIPHSITEDAYVSFSSKEYSFMRRMTEWFDEYLLGKYHRSQGMWVAQQPALSVIEWGKTAFDCNRELIKFFEMHGHCLVANRDMELYEMAIEYSLDWPSFPREGSIVDMGEYIIVHF